MTNHNSGGDVSTARIAARLRTEILDPIGESLIGKRSIIEVLAVALVAGENAFLLGPPGTGKSALVQELSRRIGGRTFDYLLTRFTEPSELFGPFDLRRLRDGDLVTNTEGMLPEADFVFLDELLNANSAILNSLLLALNERVFRRGRQTEPLPMLMAVGASNHLPEDEALSALYDRFLMRVRCDNVDDDRLGDVLAAGWRRGPGALGPDALGPDAIGPDAVESSVTVEEIRVLQRHVATVDLTPVMSPYIDLVRRLRHAGIPISDRRAVRMQRVIAASAVLCGRDRANVSDLWVMESIWESPPQAEMIRAHFAAVRRAAEEAGATTPDQAKPDPGLADHPMSRRDDRPDADRLGEMIDRIAARPDDPTAPQALGLLAGRVAWVKNETQRQALRKKIQDAIALTSDRSPDDGKPRDD